ncbi:hypothetical protein DFK10_13995 [Salibaculum griseiflavum]|uniref:Putative Flp pilus-assembly TadG-like N-terminal domain-containing protein n=2 Tax=Salibaculum griseiflavum TaxID=1914409 RepID=A0A2V1P0C8_9RHOB|nr:hypothetical protein DFK10_13995 [Salibaculum griseiflavum]
MPNTRKPEKTRPDPAPWLHRFRRDEEGGMIIFFSLFLFVLILWFGGMAVDYMRFETTRAKLQGTLDRAVLAAADLDQTLPPAEVVENYFETAGLRDYLIDSPQVDEGLNYRVVSASAEANMPMFFTELPRVFMEPFQPGLSTLKVSSTSTAEERVSDVEVSLVLDVSGSMDRNNRIQNLRPAAREFVSTVLANNTNAPNGLITISMIPYSAVVNPGTQISPFLNISRTHPHSTCPLFEDDVFDTTELDLSETYDHVSHFDPDWYWDSRYNNPIKYPWCHEGDHNGIVLTTSNEGLLHNAIDALQPYGNTAIDMGMKWGVGLLDPSTRPIMQGLAGQTGSSVPAAAADRPQSFDDDEVLKIVVLMTDGQNTSQYDLEEPMKSGMSMLWFDRDYAGQPLSQVDSNEFSVQYAGLDTPDYRWDDRFYWNGFSWSSRWRDYPNGFDSRSDYINATPESPTGIAGQGVHYEDNVYHASWQDMYAEHVYNRINNIYLSRAYNDGALSWYEYRAPDYALDTGLVNSWQADNRLSEICATARDAGVVIYTVAFEAPSGGQIALRDCASSPNHYFNVDGVEISEAFSAIASDIRALKLTK